MKKILMSAILIAASVGAYAQFLPSTGDPNDIFYSNGRVGIGLSNPTSRFDVLMPANFMYRDVSGIRLTYPIPALSNDLPAPPIVNTSVFEIRQQTLPNAYASRMVMNTRGNLGIGVPVTDPLLGTERVVITDNNERMIDLHVQGFTLVDGKDASLLLGRTTGAQFGEWGIEYNENYGGLNFWKPAGSNNFGNHYMFISDQGKVGIGVAPTEMDTEGDYKLYVGTGILTEKVKVALRNTEDWADYVFKPDYHLMDLKEVETYIIKYGHLPGVPAAEEVKENGIDMARMDAKLLEKIEELTLYMIDLKKENEAMRAELNKLKQ